MKTMLSMNTARLVSVIIFLFGESYSDEKIPANTVTPYSNLTIPILEIDEQSNSRMLDLASNTTKNNHAFSQEVLNNTLRNNLGGRGMVKPLPDRNVCGPLAEEDRIYGGENTAIDEFPWLVRIKYVLAISGSISDRDPGLIYLEGEAVQPQVPTYLKSPKEHSDNGKEVYACAGSLITDHYVLTAAHCAVNLTIKEVRLGDWNLETEFDCHGKICSGNAENVKIIKVIPFPGYNKLDTFKGDIALLQLQRSVKFTDFIRPICLPTSAFVSKQDYSTGSVYWTAGWGKTEFEKKPSIKKKVELGAVPISECRIRHPILSDQTAPFTICAGGTEGKDTCVGDSGGSLVKQVHENRTTNWFLMGVTSYGYKECGSEGRPGLYARITPYINWIIQNIT